MKIKSRKKKTQFQLTVWCLVKDLKKTTQSKNKITGSNNNKITDHMDMWNKLIWRGEKKVFWQSCFYFTARQKEWMKI